MNRVLKWLLLCMVWCSALLSCAAPDALIITDPIFSMMRTIEGDPISQVLSRELEDLGYSVVVVESPIPIGTAFDHEQFEELIRRVEREDPKTVIASPLITSLIGDSLSLSADRVPENLNGLGQRHWVFWNISERSIRQFTESFPQMINIRPTSPGVWEEVGRQVAVNELRLGMIRISGDVHDLALSQALESGYTSITGESPIYVTIKGQSTIADIRRACATLVESEVDVIPVYAGESSLDILRVIGEFPMLQAAIEGASLIPDEEIPLFVVVDWDYPIAYLAALDQAGEGIRYVVETRHEPSLLWY